MSAAQPDRALIEAWRSGDELAATTLFDRYLVRLTSLARARLSRRLARRIDPEDVVLSAYRSFFVAAADGRVSLAEDDNLWPLLVVITLRKVARQAGRHQAGRRTVDQEVPLDSILPEAVAAEPTVEQAAVLEEELTRVMRSLSPLESDVLARTLQGESQSSIATTHACSERTVRRAIARVRKSLIKHGDLEPQLTSRQSRPPSAGDGDQRPLSPVAEFPHPTIELRDLDLRKMIATGGFAKVYRSHWKSEGQVVAVKFLRKKFWHNASAVNLMLNEMCLLRHLDHPHILPLLGWGRARDRAPFLVLDWVDGGNLTSWIERRPRSADEIVGVMRPVIEAVIAAHHAGVVHCDLKPDNVLIRRDGRPMLTDFGFARTIGPESPHLPRGGTAGYLAPELVSSAFGVPDERTDVYGIGGLLYTMLTRHPPFAGDSVPEILANVVSAQRPDSVSDKQNGVPGWLAQIVDRCLFKEPADRFPDANSVLNAIDSRP